MAYLDDLIGELKTVAGTVVALPVPGAGQTNTFAVMQGINQNFVNAINSTKVLLPCLVIEIGEFNPELDFGLDNWGQNRIPCTIHYVAQLAGDSGTQAGVDAQARKIALYIDDPANSFSTFGAYESGMVASDLNSAINEALLAVSKVNVISSCVKWDPGFLVNFLP